MNRQFLKVLIMIVSILSAHLLTSQIDSWIQKYKFSYNSYVSTWIGMGIVIIIYYPLFEIIEKWSNKSTGKALKAGKKLTGKNIGTILFFLLFIVVLYYFYGKMWFNTNVILKMVHAMGL